MLSRMLKSWCKLTSPALLGCPWMAALLGALTLLDLWDGAVFLLPPFAATLTILVYLPNTPVAQPVAVVCGSVFGAATGTGFSLALGSGAGVAMLAALAAMIMLPLLRAGLSQSAARLPLMSIRTARSSSALAPGHAGDRAILAALVDNRCSLPEKPPRRIFSPPPTARITAADGRRGR